MAIDFVIIGEEVGLGGEDVGDDVDGVVAVEGVGVGGEDELGEVEEGVEKVDKVLAVALGGRGSAVGEVDVVCVELVDFDAVCVCEDGDELSHDVVDVDLGDAVGCELGEVEVCVVGEFG